MRSGYGSRLRALSSFGGLAASLADADFGGYNFSVLETVTQEEIRTFIGEHLAPERFAMSVIEAPTGGKGGSNA